MPDTVTVSAEDVQVVSDVLTLAAKAFGSALQYVPHFGDALEACGRMGRAAGAGSMPEDPVTPPAQIAIAHPEVMSAYLTAGFEREEAFAIVMIQVQAHATASALRGGSG